MRNLFILAAIALCSTTLSAQSVFSKGIQTSPAIEQSVSSSCDCDGADITGDGAVTVMDILAWNAAFGTLTTGPEDIDGDGAVTVQDQLILLSWFGQTCD